VVDQILKDLEKELRALLESKSLSGAERAQLKALVAEAESAIHPAYTAAAKSLDTQALAIIVAEKTVEAMEAFPVSALMPSVERLASLTKDVLIDGAPSSAWWERQADDTAFKFAAQVRQGVVNGETNERIVQRIVGKRGEPGIMEVSRRNARALVHSSVMTAANEARLATFRKNERLIKGVRWLSTLDSHTCVQCAALDNAAWDLDGQPIQATKLEFQLPPAHWSCRCVASPIPKTFRDIGLNIDEPAEGTRASSEGPVPASTTFDEFLKRQSPAFINKTLGKERAALFLAGKLTLRDLISGTGRELTLDQLRKHWKE
jgi:SPP1 gp7 family putative phage head morphogenesis protein